MKKTLLIVGAVVTFIVSAALFGAEQTGRNAGSHLGTWRLVATKYQDAKEFSDVPTNAVHIKMIDRAHFVWVIYDSQTKLVSASMGGSYRLNGASYTESIDYYLPKGMKIYLGSDQVFTVKIEGDRLTQSGKLSDGMKIEEVWQRVK